MLHGRPENADGVFGRHKRCPQTHHVLGLIYAGRGQFTEAASEYRRFLELSPKAQISDRVRRLLYEWEQLGVI